MFRVIAMAGYNRFTKSTATPPVLLTAGYARHRTTFTRGGASGLNAELNRDMLRIHTRNLGRDDRAVSSSGREARHPYLDEEVQRVLQAMPLSVVCKFSPPEQYPPGVGDKHVLRQVAARLGLTLAGGLVKRAMQFGSRIANRKVQGFMPIPQGN